MKTIRIFTLTYFFILCISSYTFAQDYMKWDLPEGAKLRIGKGSVSNIRFSPDGNRLTVGSSIGFWIYDAHTGDELDLISVNQNNVIGVSQDAKFYVEKSPDRTVNVRNLGDRSVITTLEGDNSDIYYVRFNLEKNILASDIGTEIRVWDLSTGELKTSIDLETEWIYEVVLSPDGTKLASISKDSDDRVFQLWDVATGSHITTLSRFAFNIRDLVFTPDSNSIISGSENSIQFWDIAAGKSGKRTLNFRTHNFNSISVSPDGKTVATGGFGGFGGLYLWDLSTGTLKTELSGHLLGVSSIAFSPDSKTIATGGYGELNLWDVESGARRLAIADHSMSVNDISFSPDNTTLAIGHWYKIDLRDVVTGQQKTSFYGSNFTYNFYLDYSPDGTILASSLYDGISLWDVKVGVPITVVRGYGFGIRGERSGYSSVAFSPDGRLLAAANGHATIHLWYGGRTQKGSLIGHSNSVTSIAFDNCGRYLASGSYDNTVRLWDVVDDTNLATFEGHLDTVICVDMGPDAQHIASGSKDKSIIIWDVQNGNQKHTLTGHTDEVYSVAFSLDGQILVSGGGRDDPTVRLWNVNTGEEIATLTGHSRGNIKIDFSPDGGTFVSGGADGTAILWDLASFIGIEDFITYRNEDVNRDGIVTIEDLILVATQFGESGEGNSADVNADGVIDVADILLVAAALASDNGAPSRFSSFLEPLSASDVQQWIKNAYQMNSNLPVYRRGITALENILTLLIPKKTGLLPNYPNPFNPETWIPYQLAKDAEVKIHIHSSNGQLIKTLQLGHKMAGLYNKPIRAAHWDGKNEIGEPVASGIYYYTLSVGSITDTRRMVIRK